MTGPGHGLDGAPDNGCSYPRLEVGGLGCGRLSLEREGTAQSFLPGKDFEVLAGVAEETAGGLVCRAVIPGSATPAPKFVLRAVGSGM